MALLATSKECQTLFRALSVALGLPKSVVSFELRMAVDEIIVVSLKYNQETINPDGVKELEMLSGRFELVEAKK